MKTLKSFLYLLVVFAIVLSACKKNVHKIDDGPDVQVRNMEDLVVPSDFDWRMHLGPTSSLKTSSSFYPTDGYSTLAFEDLWPAKGDYDFNDLVVEYRFENIKDGGGHITKIIGTFIFRALGAGTTNGFGFELIDLDPANYTITGCVVSDPPGYITLDGNGWEAGQDNGVAIVVDDLTKALPLGANTSQYGTGQYGIMAPAVIKSITILPKAPATSIDYEITEDNFNPFMIIDINHGTLRGREVHLLDMPPTDLADLSYFGTADDFSAPDFDSYYKTSKNYPWVLEIPSYVDNPTLENTVFDWPREKVDINWAYLHFDEWAETGGDDYSSAGNEWWLILTAEYRHDANIYQVP